MSNTLEKNYERSFETMEDQERRREQLRERAEVKERVMEATEQELDSTMRRAEELMHTEQKCMEDLATTYAEDARAIGIEQNTLVSLHAQLEEQKQQRLEACEQLKSDLQKTA